MREFKTVIIDDERLAREELKSLLSDFNEINVIAEAKNGEEGIEHIQSLAPDLIFLDISMPGMSGFDMIKQLEDIPRVIFVTAYDEFALKAFEVNALDYILKPIDPQRLEEAIQKLKQKEEAEFESDINYDRTQRILTSNDKIFIKENEKCYFVQLSDVRLLESDGNYVKIHFAQKRPMILRSLNRFEERLDKEIFFRANRKYIVNLNHVVGIENWFNGGLQVELSTGEKIEISRRQAIRFKEVFSI